MDGGSYNDLNDLLVFGERLKLLAQLQASYLIELRAEGFEDEQAYQLVRDWSSRGFDWTVRWVPPSASIEDELRQAEAVLGPLPDVPEPPASVDASTELPSEPYLLPYDETGLDEAA